MRPQSRRAAPRAPGGPGPAPGSTTRSTAPRTWSTGPPPASAWTARRRAKCSAWKAYVQKLDGLGTCEAGSSKDFCALPEALECVNRCGAYAYCAVAPDEACTSPEVAALNCDPCTPYAVCALGRRAQQSVKTSLYSVSAYGRHDVFSAASSGGGYGAGFPAGFVAMERLRMEEHDPTRVIAGVAASAYGWRGVAETEYWSACVDCSAEELWLELGARGEVGSVRIEQVPGYERDLVVSADLSGGEQGAPGRSGWFDGSTATGAPLDASFLQRWPAGAGSVCVPLTCARPGNVEAEVLYQAKRRMSPCACKQLCVDFFPRGCRAFRQYLMEDDHDAPAEYNSHWHAHLGTCELLKAPTRAALAAAARLRSATGPGVDPFDMSLYGVLPA